MPDLLALGIAFVVAIIVATVIVRLSLRPKKEKAPPAPPAPPPVRYKATLYNNGEVVHTMRATQGSASESGVWLVAEGANQYTIMCGTFILEPIDAPPNAPRTPQSKFKVTLYDAGMIIREWYVNQASASKSGVWMLAEGAKEYTIVGGTLLLEPLT